MHVDRLMSCHDILNRKLGLITLVVSLSFCAEAKALNLFPITCERVLASFRSQQSIGTARTTEERVQHAVALLRVFPKPFLDKNLNLILSFLNRKSPQADVIKTLMEVKRILAKSKGSFLTEQEISSHRSIDSVEEIALSLHPHLLELLRLFEIPPVEDDAVKLELMTRSIIDELQNDDPIQRQLILRMVLEKIYISRPMIDLNSYAVVAILQAALQLEHHGTRLSRKLASGLGRLISSNDLLFQFDLAERQLREQAMATLENNQIDLVRLRLAFLNLFSFSHLYSSFILGGVSYALRWVGPETPFGSLVEYFNISNVLLGALIYTNGHFFLAHYLYLQRDPHPKVSKKGKKERYLKNETDQRLRLMKVTLEAKINQIIGILTRVKTTVPTIVPVPTQGEAQESPPSESIAETSAPPAPQPGPPTPKPAPPAPRPVTVAELKPRLENLRERTLGTRDAAIKVTNESVAEAARRFDLYFKEVGSRVVERDALLQHLAIGFMMPSIANILVVSEPGVAKSRLAELVLKGIRDDNGDSRSFFIQMSPETTKDDLLGPVKPSALMQRDLMERNGMSAIPGALAAFIDEYFRGGAWTRPILLGLQADGKVPGEDTGVPEDHRVRLVIYASNTYPDKVFHQAGDESPRAEFDRMLFIHILPPTLEFDDNMIELKDIDMKNLPELRWSDIDHLRELASKVNSDRYFRSKLKLLVNRVRSYTKLVELESVRSWHERQMREGIVLTGPDYDYRELSPRTEKKAQDLLARFAVFRWLREGLKPTEGIEITEMDFARLEEFFCANTGSSEHVARVIPEYGEGSTQRQVFESLQEKRRKYRETLEKIELEISEDPILSRLATIAGQLDVPWEKFKRKPNSYQLEIQITDENANVINEFLNWFEEVESRVASRSRIREIQPQDVALDQALYLGRLILERLRL